MFTFTSLYEGNTLRVQKFLPQTTNFSIFSLRNSICKVPICVFFQIFSKSENIIKYLLFINNLF